MRNFTFSLLVLLLWTGGTVNAQTNPNSAANFLNRSISPSAQEEAGWVGKAIASARNSLEAMKKDAGADKSKLVSILYRLVRLHRESGDYTEAKTVLARAGEIISEKASPQEVSVIGNYLADIDRAIGNHSAAAQTYQEIITELEKSPEGDQLQRAIALNGLAEIHRLKRDYARAEPLYTRALENWKRADYFAKRDVETLNSLGLLYRDRGDSALAEQSFQRAIEKYKENKEWTTLWKKVRPGTDDYTDLQVAAVFLNLGDLYRAKGNLTGAELLYKQALEFREKAFGLQHRFLAEPLNKLALLYQTKGDKALAEQFLNRVRAITR